MLEGLYRDGVSNKVAERLAVVDADGMPDLFIYSCPICMPALDAFRTYLGRPAFFGDKAGNDTFGAGLPAAVCARALSTVRRERLGVLNELIGTWIERRLASLRLHPKEIESWREGFESRRKKGMAALERYQSGQKLYAEFEGCAVCDVAKGAFDKR